MLKNWTSVVNFTQNVFENYFYFISFSTYGACPAAAPRMAHDLTE